MKIKFTRNKDGNYYVTVSVGEKKTKLETKLFEMSEKDFNRFCKNLGLTDDVIENLYKTGETA